MRILEALDQHLLQLQANGRSPHTIAQAHRHVRRFAAWTASTLGTVELDDLSTADVAGFLASDAASIGPTGKRSQPGSMNALRSSLRTFLRFAHDAGFTSSNLGRLVRRAAYSQPIPRPLPPRIQDRLLGAMSTDTSPAGRRDAALFAVLAGTGLRIGAAIRLDVEDVDLGRQEVQVRHDKRGTRTIAYLTDELAARLRDHIGDRASGPLFRSTTGRRLSVRHAQRRFAAWRDAVGVDASTSAHSLRHTFALRVLQRSDSIEVTRRALGHRAIASTLVYAQAADDDVRRAVVDT